MKQLGNFAIIGIKNLLVKDKETKALKADIDKLVDIQINDELAVSYMRGGYTNPKILTLFGDRESQMVANNATLSPELLEVMANTISEMETSAQSQPPETHEIKTNKVTLSKTPATGSKLEVYKVDEFGKLIKPAMTVATSTPSASGEYKVSGKDITFHTTETGFVRVYYYAEEAVQSFKFKNIKPKSYFMEGNVVVQEIESGNVFSGVIEIPNATIQPKYSLGGKNESTEPEAIALNVDMLMDSLRGYPYKLDVQAIQTV